MRTRTRSSKVAVGLGAISAATAVGLAGTTAPAAAHAAGHDAAPRGPQTAQIPVRTEAPSTYVVRPGDTVSAIAARHGTTVAAVVRANGLDKRAVIRVGQVLRLPGASVSSTAAGSATPTQTAAASYTVRSGDTLSGIASRHGTTVMTIMRLNGLTSTVIHPGQVLRLSGSGASSTQTTSSSSSGSGGTSTSSSGSSTRYTVRSGDTVSGIAARYGTTVAAVVAANKLDSRALIRIGQVLVIPGSGSSSGSSSSGSSGSSSTGSGSTSGSSSSSSSSRTSYTVRSGDTLSGIAFAHRTTVSALMSANSLRSTVIHPGQRLTIPGSGSSSSSSSSSGGTSSGSTSSSAGGTTSYTVRSGDTLSSIAAAHGTTVAAITSQNSLTTTVIHPGQVLRVPKQLVPSTFLGYTYAPSVVAAANQNKQTLLSRNLPSRAEMQDLIRSTAVRMGVDPALALAVAHQESGFDPAAVSPANAIGVMQVIPSSGEWASGMVGEDLDLLDPRDNVVAGVAILRWLVRTAPDLRTAIAGYYQGLASVTSKGMYDDTRRYVANVQTLMTRYA